VVVFLQWSLCPNCCWFAFLRVIAGHTFLVMLSEVFRSCIFIVSASLKTSLMMTSDVVSGLSRIFGGASPKGVYGTMMLILWILQPMSVIFVVRYPWNSMDIIFLTFFDCLSLFMYLKYLKILNLWSCQCSEQMPDETPAVDFAC